MRLALECILAGMATIAEVPTKATRRMSHDELVAAANQYRIDPAGLSTEALRACVKRAGEAAWLQENAAAIEAWRAWEATNDSPLDRYSF